MCARASVPGSRDVRVVQSDVPGVAHNTRRTAKVARTTSTGSRHKAFKTLCARGRRGCQRAQPATVTQWPRSAYRRPVPSRGHPCRRKARRARTRRLVTMQARSPPRCTKRVARSRGTTACHGCPGRLASASSAAGRTKVRQRVRRSGCRSRQVLRRTSPTAIRQDASGTIIDSRELVETEPVRRPRRCATALDPPACTWSWRGCSRGSRRSAPTAGAEVTSVHGQHFPGPSISRIQAMTQMPSARSMSVRRKLEWRRRRRSASSASLSLARPLTQPRIAGRSWRVFTFRPPPSASLDRPARRSLC
jgi:hypothetical protein